MAVYKQGYRGYSGSYTPAWSRFLIPARYAFKHVFHSRLFTAFFVACFFYPVGCLAFLYLNHNLRLLALLNIHEIVPINGEFFYVFLQAQGGLAFVLAAFVGPGLVSPDLSNNALPLYFSRPFSRLEYGLGKASVLVFLLSTVTWVPGLVLYFVQSELAGARWMAEHLWIAAGIVLASCIRILIYCVLALALSAWIRWRVVAGAALLGVFFVSAGFGHAINALMDTENGTLFNLDGLISTIERDLLRQPLHGQSAITSGTAFLALMAVCVLCLTVLERKVRAVEVVRG